MAAYRLTPARRAALKKAQIASARKRRGTGKRRVTSNRRRNVKRAAVAVGAVAAAAGAGYVYKNRERLIIAKRAEARALDMARRRAGRRLTKTEKYRVRMQERKDHASRSTYRVREYLKSRDTARIAYRKLGVSSLRPDKKNSIDKVINRISGPGTMTAGEARYTFMNYRRDVYSRAVQRHGRMTGKKNRFSYESGKRLKVSKKGVVKRMFW